MGVQYVYAESSLRLVNETARLISPVYPPDKSLRSCLKFAFHLHGADMGSLEVGQQDEQDDTDMKDGVRTIAFKPDDDSLYLIGTDEGNIYLCTTEYSTAFIMSYYAHITPVNTVVWNTFYPSLFLSCASEQTIYFWHKDLAGRITDETDLLL